MPWFTMPYSVDKCESLCKKLKVDGYPTFVVFSSLGKPLDSDAATTVQMGSVDLALQKWLVPTIVDVDNLN